MAHECPECGQVCYCNGDIDDCLYDSEYYYIHCHHYLECQKETDDDDDYSGCNQDEVMAANNQNANILNGD